MQTRCQKITRTLKQCSEPMYSKLMNSSTKMVAKMRPREVCYIQHWMTMFNENTRILHRIYNILQQLNLIIVFSPCSASVAWLLVYLTYRISTWPL